MIPISAQSDPSKDPLSSSVVHGPGAVPTPTPRSIRRLAIVLAALAMLGPFSIDAYLPAFPDIGVNLHASQLEVQQTLSAYLVSFSFMILWHGALSDSLGRRNVILVALSIFIVSSIGCASAPSIGMLWGFRVLQGVSAGAGIVVGRAMIRDLYSGHEAERLLSLVTMIFAIGPAVAPILGGWIVSALGWRAIFLFLFGFCSLLLWLCWFQLPETLPRDRRHPLHPRSLAKRYWVVFGTLRFHLYAGVIAANFAGLFLYVAAAPTFVIQHLHLGPRQFGWQFVPAVAGVFTGALLSNRFAGRVRVQTQIRFGFTLLVLAASANLGYHLVFPPAIPWSVIPLFFYCVGMAMCAPGVTLLVLDLFPQYRGIAASCQSFAQMILSSVVAGVIAPLLAPSALWLAIGQFTFVVLGLSLWVVARSSRSAPGRPFLSA